MLKAALLALGGFFAAKPADSLPADKKAEVQKRVIAMLESRYSHLRATYDAARTSTEYQNIWANADAFDADSAHSREVRHALIQRSRYEAANNGYADGIAQTYSTDLVGVGPTLQMETSSQGFNRMVENAWFYWSKATKFRRKLWCMAHAKHVDGESFATMRKNPNLRHEIKLDIVLHEADQVQTPYLPFGEPGRIDGIRFDEFGNPLVYEILKQHPGAVNQYQLNLIPEEVPADRVLHWYRMRRPGQHRAVPECSSTLNVGAASRRYREAVLAAAETAADFTMFLKTQFQPDSEEMQYATDFSQQEITKRMMTALPLGYEPFQMKAEQPTTNYGDFSKSLIAEQARPKCMPYNRAGCDNTGNSFSGGKLDSLPYFSALDVDREDCNDVVLDPLFETWFDLAVVRYGWLGGNPVSISQGARAHKWDWPQHDVADIQTEANANKTKLSTGELTLSQLYAKQGRDYDDELETMASDYGVTTDEMREILRNANFNLQNQQASMAQAETQAKQSEQPAAPVAAELPINRLLKVNGGANGHH